MTEHVPLLLIGLLAALAIFLFYLQTARTIERLDAMAERYARLAQLVRLTHLADETQDDAYAEQTKEQLRRIMDEEYQNTNPEVGAP